MNARINLQSPVLIDFKWFAMWSKRKGGKKKQRGDKENQDLNESED